MSCCDDNKCSPIDMSKTYQTKEGHKVRIYATDGDDHYCVHGAILGWTYKGGWKMMRWDSHGNTCPHLADPRSDLVEVKPKVHIKGWLNINSNGEGYLYKDRCEADRQALGSRIGCVHLDQEGENNLS